MQATEEMDVKAVTTKHQYVAACVHKLAMQVEFLADMSSAFMVRASASSETADAAEQLTCLLIASHPDFTIDMQR